MDETSKVPWALTPEALAKVHKPPPEPPQATWEALSDPGYREAGGEFLIQTDDAPGNPALEELLATTRSVSSPLAMLLLISELIPDRFEYRQGATYVDSTVNDLFEVGAGVCQDFVHLGLCLLRHHQLARLPHRVDNRVLVQWAQRSQVNDLHVNPLPSQLLRSSQGSMYQPSVAHHSDVATLPLHIGDAQGNQILLIRHLALQRVAPLMLHEDNRVIVANG